MYQVPDCSSCGLYSIMIEPTLSTYTEPLLYNNTNHSILCDPPSPHDSSREIQNTRGHPCALAHAPPVYGHDCFANQTASASRLRLVFTYFLFPNSHIHEESVNELSLKIGICFCKRKVRKLKKMLNYDQLIIKILINYYQM